MAPVPACLHKKNQFTRGPGLPISLAPAGGVIDEKAKFIFYYLPSNTDKSAQI